MSDDGERSSTISVLGRSVAPAN